MMGKGMSWVVVVGGTVVLWRVIDGMNREALAMALGMLFGILAGVPVALLVLAGQRRTPERAGDKEELDNSVDDWRWVGPGGQQPAPRVRVIEGRIER